MSSRPGLTIQQFCLREDSQFLIMEVFKQKADNGWWGSDTGDRKKHRGVKEYQCRKEPGESYGQGPANVQNARSNFQSQTRMLSC